MISLATPLSTFELAILKGYFETLIFPQNYRIFHEKQVPSVGMVLLEGEAYFMAKKKIIRAVQPNVVMGISHLLNNTSTTHACELFAQSQILIIPKSDLLQIQALHSTDLRRKILLSKTY